MAKSDGWMRRGEVYLKGAGFDRRWFWGGKRLDGVGKWSLADRERGGWGQTVPDGVGWAMLHIAALADRTQGSVAEDIRTRPWR